MHYYVYDRPAGCVCTENPARFTWMPPAGNDAPCCIEVMRQGRIAYRFEGIDRNFYTPDHVMEPGAYTYRVLAGEEVIVPEKPFAIAGDAVHTPLVSRDRRYDAIGAHPRIWLRPEELPRAREAVAGPLRAEWEAFLASGVTPWMNVPVKPEPAPYPGNVRVIPLWRQMYVDCQEALYAVKHSAVAYRLTGDAIYLDNARRWLMALARWDVNGPTARSYNDEAAFRVTTALAWGYDWLHDDLSADERQCVRDALLARGRELFRYVTEDIRIHVKLLDSHGVRSLSMTLVPAALALFGEAEDARRWLDYTIEYFFCLFTPWGGDDGGWAEGPAYWQTGVSFFTEAITLIRKATGVDAFARPFFRNTGRFILNTYCQDTRFMAFGDMSDLGDYPGLKAGFTMRILSAATDNPLAPQFAWYYEQARERGKGTEGLFYNYGWWNFDFDELFFRLLGDRSVKPAPPPEGISLTWFRDIGWVTLHRDMADENRHLAFHFKASPYGSVSHSHGDQNAFVLHAFGEPLAIQSGYYVGFWSSMHLNWRRQTLSKNAVTIGGRGQFATLRKTSRAEEMNGSAKSQYEQLIAARGAVEDCRMTGDTVYIRGDATPAFAATVPGLLANKRHVLYQAAGFFVIVDEIRLTAPEVIDFRLHALKPFALGDRAARMTGRKAGLTVLFSQDMAMTQRDVFDGVDPAEYEGLPTQYHLCATTRAPARDHTLVTVLYPFALGEEKPVALAGMRITFGGRAFDLVREGEGYTLRAAV
ncbi:MAG: DUF4962 domain-containing protein [Aristaeellaceae bacterium]